MSARVGTTPRRMIAVLSAAVVCLALALGTAGAASAATRTTYPQYSGERLLATPSTAPCVVDVVDAYPFKNTAYGPDKNFSGHYTPPTGCDTSWSRVTATMTVHVDGVQFDRTGDLALGTTTLWSFTTSEPAGGAVRWTKAKDITDYSALLRRPGTLHYDLGNVVDSTYTGVYYGSLKLTYYPADAANPVPAGTPDQVVPVVSDASISAGTPSVGGSVRIARNTTSLSGALFLQGQGGCDEFWWADAPAPFPGQCGTPAYREAEVHIDGRLAGVLVPHPYLFTGAGGPSWWEPIPAPQAWDLQAYRLDLTPFIGILDDGAKHSVTVSMLDWTAGDGDFFRTSLNLLGQRAGTPGRTKGDLVSASAPAHATILQSVTATKYQMTGADRFKAVGWTQTGNGPKVTTTIVQQIGATVSGKVIDPSTGLSTVSTDYTWDQRSTAVAAAQGTARPSTQVAQTRTQEILNAPADGWWVGDNAETTVTRDGAVLFHSLKKDSMRSTESTAGVHTSSERWRYADTDGACGTTTLAASLPLITRHTQSSRCIWTPVFNLARSSTGGALRDLHASAGGHRTPDRLDLVTDDR